MEWLFPWIINKEEYLFLKINNSHSCGMVISTNNKQTKRQNNYFLSRVHSSIPNVIVSIFGEACIRPFWLGIAIPAKLSCREGGGLSNWPLVQLMESFHASYRLKAQIFRLTSHSKYDYILIPFKISGVKLSSNGAKLCQQYHSSR